MTLIEKIKQQLIEKGEKISKARRVRSLIQKQKGLLKTKQSLTQFDEPVLFLVRRDGKMDIFEKATAGKFMFEHSTGKPRFIELRPSDQITFDYADRKVRGYVANEDRPFAGWDNPIVDSESIMLGYEKTKATDLKYQERIEALKNKSKMTWVYILIGLAVAILIVAFAYNTWIQPALANKAKAEAEIAEKVIIPTAGIILTSIKNRFIKKKRHIIAIT